jgi:hypothetical protein
MRPGTPDVPTRTLLVAIPPGAVPRLELRVLGEVARPGIVPQPVAEVFAEPSSAEADALIEAEDAPGRRVEILSATERKRFRRDGRLYDGEALYPKRVAWLGEVGVLRDQRYVQVHLAPVRFDPAIDGLRVATGVELTVHFDGAAERRLPPRVEPRFENLYRKRFVNYAQGREFRLSTHPSAADSVPAPGSLAGGGARARIRIRADGMVRLDAATLAPTGLLSHPISTWRLTNRGEQIPMQIQDGGDDVMGLGEWVQFYAQALDARTRTSTSWSRRAARSRR